MSFPAARWLAGALLVGGAAALYFVDLAHSPVYLGGDEAHFGVVALSMARSGRTLVGDPLPLFVDLADPQALAHGLQVDAWGRTWYQPVLFYLIALVLKVLPFSEASVRAPTAFLSGILSPLLMYAVAMRMFKKRSLAVTAAVMLALAPPMLILGRQALDYVCPLPFILGWLWCLTVFLEGGRVWPAFLGGMLLGFGSYSYIASWVMMPIYLALSWLVFLRADKPARAIAASTIGFALPLLLLVPWLQSHPAMLHEIFERYRLSREQSVVWRPSQVSFLERVRLVAAAYLSYFDPVFLFRRGGPSMTTSTGRVGALLLSMAVFLPVGAAALVRRRDGTGLRVVLFAGLAFAPIAAALTGTARMSQRGMYLMPFAVLISAVGFDWMRRQPARAVRVLSTVLLVALVAQFTVFARDYFTHYKLRSAFYYDPIAFHEVAEYLMADEGVPAIYLSTELDDAPAKWRFYSSKSGREDLLMRTWYFEGNGLELDSVPPGSLLVMYVKAADLKALVGTGHWSLERTVSDIDRRAAAAILKRTG